ncbi:MAG: PEP-CTERM sorting domain-containing protein [Fimbriimonadales bacterium]|nr:PEP-CTERM sorting domain-containing protein [Fimbriimonadales bacterium]
MRAKILATAFAAVLAAASQAVIVTFGGFNQNPGGALGAGLYAKHGSATTFAGQILGTIQGHTSPTVFYCIAPDKVLPVPNSIDYNVTLAYGPMGAVLHHAFGLANANQNEAARQLELWQMVGDDISQYLPTGGNAAALNAAKSAANSYTATGAAWYAIFTPKSGNTQTLVTASYQTTGLPVPEPLTIGLFASGLATALRRRRRR